MTTPIAAPSSPTLRALLDVVKQETLASDHCQKLGKIVSFDAGTQSASVQLQSLYVLPDGTAIPYPVLTDCPVFVLSGGGATLRMPIAAGDPCLVMFNDVDIDNWFATGNVVSPNSPRTHSLSDGLVLVGFYNKATALSSYSATDVGFFFKGAHWSVDGSGNLTIVVAAGKTVSVGVTSGAHVDLTSKVAIANAATDMKTLWDALITALTGWVNTGGTTPNATTVTALNAAKTLGDSLFT